MGHRLSSPESGGKILGPGRAFSQTGFPCKWAVIMLGSIGLVLTSSFLISLVALAFLIWAVANQQLRIGQQDALTVFDPGEAGQPDDPTAFGNGHVHSNGHRFDVERLGIDKPSRIPVLLLLVAAAVWLVVGSVFGMIASLKLHLPDWLNASELLTFGRVRTLHLNAVAYGWLSMAGIAVALWTLPRVFHTPLRLSKLPVVGVLLWNAALIAGLFAVSTGSTDGLEWLEIPWRIDVVLGVAGAFFAVPLVVTALKREVDHIYVTGWYYLAALVWFPILFLIANLPAMHSGVPQATVNWWYAHNVLGLWLTPLGVGAAYYFIPKIIGKPIYSYTLSLVGFWALALFYSQVGIHHLIGGPVPTWLVTLSVVHSVMMFVPVLAVAINQHVTVGRNMWAFRQSLALRFVATGAVMYTLASFQGSIEAIRSVNTVTHFTHYTVGHAHLGAYAFTSLVMFGAIYHMVPRLTGRDWPFPSLLSLHYWLVIVGFALYFVALTAGGLLQGLAMLDVARPFADSVTLTIPYLQGRSLGGALMSVGHLVFAAHLFLALGRMRAGASSPRGLTSTETERFAGA